MDRKKKGKEDADLVNVVVAFRVIVGGLVSRVNLKTLPPEKGKLKG